MSETRKLLESIQNNYIKESTTEEYWDGTELARDGFISLLRFNFGTDAQGNNYIICNDSRPWKKFYAASDEEAKEIYEKWKNKEESEDLKESMKPVYTKTYNGKYTHKFTLLEGQPRPYKKKTKTIKIEIEEFPKEVTFFYESYGFNERYISCSIDGNEKTIAKKMGITEKQVNKELDEAANECLKFYDDFVNEISNMNENEDLKESDEPFSGVEFEKNVPHEMRFKEYDIVNTNDLYWVTQQPFSLNQLNQFAEAFKNTKFSKAYVTVRDFSTYDFERDNARNVFAIVDKYNDTIDPTGYIEAVKKEGWEKILEESEKLDESLNLYDRCYNTDDREELKELALNGIYVANNDKEIIGETMTRMEDRADEYREELTAFAKAPYDFVANNYTNMPLDLLREIALNAIYVADNDEAVQKEINDRMNEAEETDDEKYKNYLRDTLNSRKVIIISNDEKHYTPTKFLINNGKVYYNNKEISFGWEEHPEMKSIEDLINHIITMEEEGCTIAAQDRTDKDIINEAATDEGEEYDGFIYQLVGGDLAGMYTLDELKQLPIFTDKDSGENPGRRKELKNQPILDGYYGPMWNGVEDGKGVIRYETPEMYDMLSESEGEALDKDRDAYLKRMNRQFKTFCNNTEVNPNDLDDVLSALDELEGQFGDETGEYQELREFIYNELLNKPVTEEEKPIKKEILKETGEWDDNDPDMVEWLEEMRRQAEELANQIGGEVKSVHGFDAYQGPYAIVHSPKYGDMALWFDQEDDRGLSFNLRIAHVGWISGGINQLAELLNKDKIEDVHIYNPNV